MTGLRLLLAGLGIVAVLLILWRSPPGPETPGPAGRSASAAAAAPQRQAQGPEEARARLIDDLRRQGIEDERVLAAMNRVPRERFVPARYAELAYADQPLPIGHDQTISQPAVVGLMSELLETAPGDRVLEIGTGSGYQAAVLAELGCEVFSIEIIGELARTAEARLNELGYDTIHVRHGDGYLGWPEEAPFDRVIVTAAPEDIPQALVEQLRIGGRMVVPVGRENEVQQLTLLEKQDDGDLRVTRVLPVRFVPMRRKGR